MIDFAYPFQQRSTFAGFTDAWSSFGTIKEIACQWEAGATAHKDAGVRVTVAAFANDESKSADAEESGRLRLCRWFASSNADPEIVGKVTDVQASEQYLDRISAHHPVVIVGPKQLKLARLLVFGACTAGQRDNTNSTRGRLHRRLVLIRDRQSNSAREAGATAPEDACFGVGVAVAAGSSSSVQRESTSAHAEESVRRMRFVVGSPVRTPSLPIQAEDGCRHH